MVQSYNIKTQQNILQISFNIWREIISCECESALWNFVSKSNSILSVAETDTYILNRKGTHQELFVSAILQK